MRSSMISAALSLGLLVVAATPAPVAAQSTASETLVAGRQAVSFEPFTTGCGSTIGWWRVRDADTRFGWLFNVSWMRPGTAACGASASARHRRAGRLLLLLNARRAARGVHFTARMDTIRELMSDADLDEALAHGLALIYKHSPYCGLSSTARHEVFFFSEGNPDVPVYQVDVIHQRPLSQRIAELLEIEHESPQAILVRAGRPVSWASHRGVTAYALESELKRLRAA